MAELKSQKHTYNDEKGSILFIAVTIAALVLTIAVAIVRIVERELSLAFLTKESQIALYAADSGVECALFWDQDREFFATSTDSVTGAIAPAIAMCGGQVVPNTHFSLDATSADAATTTFEFVALYDESAVGFASLIADSENPCVTVTVEKWYITPPAVGYPVPQTRIRAEGFNTCDYGSDRRVVTRAVQVTY